MRLLWFCIFFFSYREVVLDLLAAAEEHQLRNAWSVVIQFATSFHMQCSTRVLFVKKAVSFVVALSTLRTSLTCP